MQSKCYGYFGDGGKKFAVKEVNTILPQVNYFWNDRFISGVSQHMAGIGSFMGRPLQYMHPECRCLLVRDENRHFYIRDDETGAIWSPGWYPVLTPLDEFGCSHGMGYSVLYSEYDMIAIEMKVFVPLEGPVEIWKVSISNKGSNIRKIRIYSFVDWLLTGYDEYCDYHSCLHSDYDKANHLLMCFNEAPERPHNFFNGFISSDIAPSGFDSSRKAFLGYSQVNMPDAVARGHCSNSLGVCEKLVGVLEHAFTLGAGEKTEFHVVIGAADSLTNAAKLCEKLFKKGRIEEEFAAMKEKLEKDYGRIFIRTPEDKINFLFNYWIKRSIALHSEVGTDTGKGFRDIMQAAWAISGFDARGARQKIIDCLEHQYSDGHTLRGWNPIDAHHYSDGPVWIAPAVVAYLKETGDAGFLNTSVPYFDRGEESVWAHILTAIRHSTDDLGPHGLIRVHYGDWNDSLNMLGNEGRGESIWTSIGMIYSIKQAIEIVTELIKDDELSAELMGRLEKLTTSVNVHGWDEAWYLEAYNDSGDKIGSHEETEGYVYLNPQTWAIMAGIVDEERLPRLLKVIDHDLECEYGSLTLTPGYRRPNPGIGRLTWFVPGMWENASPYCHGTAFKIMADTCLKRGNAAFRSIMKILPDSEENPSSHSGCPPYMVTNMYYGPEHPRKGEILYSWITGTADWLFKTMCSHIIGVRADFNGLTVDPCVPSHWECFSIQREYRGAIYNVEFHNPHKKESGTTYIEIDEKVLKGSVLRIFGDGKIHNVKVIM